MNSKNPLHFKNIVYQQTGIRLSASQSNMYFKYLIQKTKSEIGRRRPLSKDAIVECITKELVASSLLPFVENQKMDVCDECNRVSKRTKQCKVCKSTFCTFSFGCKSEHLRCTNTNKRL